MTFVCRSKYQIASASRLPVAVRDRRQPSGLADKQLEKDDLGQNLLL